MDMFLPKPGVTTCCTSKGFVIDLDIGKWGWWGDGTESSLEHVVDPSRPEVLLSMLENRSSISTKTL